MKIHSRSELGKLLEHFGLPKIIAEIGTAEGRFSSEILAWGVEKLYLVDLFEHVPFIEGCASFDPSWHEDNYRQVQQRIKGHEDKVEILKGFSHRMSKCILNETLSLVYLDGDHTYKGVLSDLEYWTPKVRVGGIVAGHDFLNPTYGVNKAVQDFCAGKYEAITIPEGNMEDAGFYFIKI